MYVCMYKSDNSLFALFEYSIVDLDANILSSKRVHMLLQTLGHERVALVLFALICFGQIINTISHNSKMAKFTPISISPNTKRVGHVFLTLRCTVGMFKNATHLPFFKIFQNVMIFRLI